MTAISTENKDFFARIDELASTLVQSRSSDEGTVISLPSVYPSGAPVTVRIHFDGTTCFVDDMGQARHEAELLGATERVFANQARETAEQFGVQFDNQSFFAIYVDLDRLVGAIQMIGAASQKSVVLAEAKMIEQNDRSIRADLLDRLEEVFGRTSVEKDIEIKGSSSHSWKFAGRVLTDRGLYVFDAITSNPNAIFSAHARFSDIRLLENAPKGVIGVPSLSAFKPDYRNLLQQAANLIEIGASDKDYSVFGQSAA